LDQLGPVIEFIRLIWAVDHSLQTASRRMEKLSGVNGPQRLVLRIVGLRPGVSAGEVAELLSLHPSTLTGILQRLQGKGLLQRKADPVDARRVLLHLTAKGRALTELRHGHIEGAVRRVLTRLPGHSAPTGELLGMLAAELLSDEPPELSQEPE
jgi:DNA-binding MarR family transcriptional regulator